MHESYSRSEDTEMPESLKKIFDKSRVVAKPAITQSSLFNKNREKQLDSTNIREAKLA